ncbi:MAG: response regulator transcription factor [Saprospiraceae bacterium]|nr:response regulator transcription factor [Saprospiraceae bacterium]
MINILLADDHQILLDGIKAMLESDQDLQVVGTASHGLQALELLKKLEVDVLLLDLQMPVMDGLETILHALKIKPDLKILILTTNDEGSIITSIFKKGAMGYLLKNSSKENLIQGIRDAYAGKKVLSAHLTSKMIESLNEKPKVLPGQIPQITKRELEVIKLIAKEYTTQQIAQTLFLSVNTVATHKRNLFVKMDVKNSVGMIKKAADWGLL